MTSEEILWTEQTPPPAPAVSSPEKATREAELEALRQRGLAKLLNRHFTEACRKIAQEKAAADAALRDLEARKRNTSEFKGPTVTEELGQWESLYHNVNQWRKECQAKERETLLLYQRYVYKFGKTAQVKAPSSANASPNSAVLNSPQPAVPPPMQSPSLSNAPELPDLTGSKVEGIREYYRRQFVQDGDEEGGALAERPFMDWSETADERSPLYIKRTIGVEDNDEDSVISGLTANSAFTRGIMLDCERSVAEFLREEREAIRHLIREEQGSTTTSVSGEVGSVHAQAAEQAETMAKQMQEILSQFKQNTSKVVTREPRPYTTNNQNEKWMVYYDETYKREYYHELNTNRTQWEAPEVDASSVSGYTDVLSHNEVMPEVETPRISRRVVYRRQQRRRRKRLITGVAALAVASVATGFYVNTHRGECFAAIDWLTGQDKVKEARLQLEIEKRRRFEAKRKEKERLAALKAEEQRRQEEHLSHEDTELIAKEDEVKRPWGCNIPFAYVTSKRCNRLASQKPAFDVESLVMDMMQ